MEYLQYTRRKILIIFFLVFLSCLVGIYAINAGSAELTPYQVIRTLLGLGEGRADIIIWNIRLPRVLAAFTAGVGLSVAGCVMQNILRNPLASPSPWAFPRVRHAALPWPSLPWGREAPSALWPTRCLLTILMW